MALLNRTMRMAAALTLYAMVGAAHSTTITREFTAAWYDPSRAGHGLGLEVIESNAGKNALAYWFTYDKQGQQLWLFGTAPVLDDSVTMTVFSTSGGSFDNSFDPSQVRTEPWGTLQISFSDCNTGSLVYAPNDPAQPAGSMPLQRSTRLFNSTCTGGVSDDRRSGAAELELIEFLVNRGVFSSASAKAKFEERADRTEFSVELEDVPAADYLLRVDGTPRGTIRVTAGVNGTEGELEFRSPPEPGKVLLDFDPRDAVLEILDGTSQVLFDALFDGQMQTTPTPPTAPPASGAPPNGNAIYELVIEPSGNDGPELHAKLKQRSDRVEFSVELEDLPIALYSLSVGGIERGKLSVVAVQGGAEGELEFRNPIEPGKILLDFDPRGELIEISLNGATVISGTFPATPTGPIDDGGTQPPTVPAPPTVPSPPTVPTPPPTPAPPTAGVVSTALISTGVDSDANGEASFEFSANEREFEVEVEDLPDGNYDLLVAGINRATIVVEDEEGRVKFNSPARADRLPLDFDPRGSTIEVSQGGTVYLIGTMP